jgi:hypothetical protein
MKPEGHVEIYRVAFDAAKSELTEIITEFERLCVRKDHIERLIQVLQPLLGEGDPAAEHGPIAGSAPKTETAREAPIEAHAEQETVPADPFQRRIDHVLGIGGGIRDVRKYSRQF